MASTTERRSKSATTQVIVVTVVLAVIAVAVAVSLILTHHSPPQNPYPGTGANRAACATIKEHGVTRGAATVTKQPRGGISESLWLDLVAVKNAVQIGDQTEIDAAAKLVVADCSLVGVS